MATHEQSHQSDGATAASSTEVEAAAPPMADTGPSIDELEEQEEQKALARAAEAGETMEPENMARLMFQAVAVDDDQRLQHLINLGVDLTATNELAQTALETAVEKSKHRTRKLLELELLRRERRERDQKSKHCRRGSLALFKACEAQCSISARHLRHKVRVKRLVANKKSDLAEDGRVTLARGLKKIKVLSALNAFEVLAISAGSHYEGEALDIPAEAANGEPGDVAAKAKAQRFAASAVKTEEETAEKALLQAAREEEKAKVSQLVANLMRLAP